ncbi:MAG: DNA primase [Planctomycetaceae bacterium]
MTISPERQSYKCWVCNEGGDCFSWVMKYDGLGFREALELLARRANLEIPASSRRGSKSENNEKSKQSLIDALMWAEEEFHQFLLNAKDAERARNYLKERGFSAEIIKTYRVGYHPNEWEWLLNRAEGKFSPQILLAARLIAERRDGSGYRDEFVDRVMFPIHDDRGRAVAFGGRILPDNTRENVAKYWNSPESAVFTKSRLLYGLDVARDAIRSEKQAIVVEGYTDCMMIQQHGVGNVVATLGTALGESHVQLLRRFAQQVVLVYDGDAPGQQAADRAVAQFLSQKVDLRVLTLPAGEDPADYLSTHGVAEFRTLIEQAPEALEYKLQSASSKYNLQTVDGRHRVLNEMIELLAASPRLSGSVQEDIILGKLSQRLNLAERTLRQNLNEARRNNTSRKQSFPAELSPTNSTDEPHNSFDTPVTGHDDLSPSSKGDEKLERELLEIIFAAPETVERIAQEIGVADFGNPHLRALFQICLDLTEEGELAGYRQVTLRLEDPELKRLAVEIDDVAERKDLGRKLRGEFPSSPTSLPLLEEVISRLKWTRRINRVDAVSATNLAEPTTRGNLGPDAKARLRQLTELRQADPTMKLRLETGRNG